MKKSMNRLLLALLAAFCFGAYNVFMKIASGYIHEITGAVILQFVAAIAGLAILLYIKYGTNEVITISQKGIMYSVLAGLCVGGAEIVSFIVFGKGVPASTGIPIIIGGAIVVGTVIGMLFLKEKITTFHVLGTVLIILGILLVSR